MPLSQTVGATFRALFDSVLPFDASSIALEITASNLTVNEELIPSDGFRQGTRTRHGVRTRKGRRGGSGTITMPLTPAAVGFFMPTALGAAVSSGIYNVAETLPAFQILEDGGDMIRHFVNCKASQIEVVSEPGQAMSMTITIESEDVNEDQTWPGSPPSIAVDPIFIHSDLGDMALGGLSFEHHRFSWGVNNFVTADEWANNLTRENRLLAQDREVSGSFDADPISENAAIMLGSTTASLTVIAVSGTWTLTILFGLAQFPKSKATTTSKASRRLSVPFMSRQSATNPDIRVTLVTA